MSVDWELSYIAATTAIGLFRAGELSPRELLEAVIERAEQVEPVVNAFTDTYFEQALERADAAADAYANGTARPLEGLAVAVKDEPRIAGQRTTQGSRLMVDAMAEETDPIADRIIRAGGIVHARTTTPEFSLAMVTWSFLHGVTRSPWNPAITPGGSSGGSAASLAAGTSTLASASDIGGSIRGPAAMCGLVGFKPPWGRVPELWPWNRESYSASGPLARTVADTALLENVIAGPLDSDMFSLERLDLPDPLPSGRGLRVAISRDLGYFGPCPEVLAALEGAAERLRSTGIEVVEVDLGWTEQALDVAMVHVHFQARALLEALVPPDRRPELTPYIQDYLDADEVTVVDWQTSWLYADQMYAELNRKVFAAGCDALICPTSTATNVPADFGHPDGEFSSLSARDSFRIFMTYPFNVLGKLPVLNIPIGIAPSTGVPIGMQIVGPINADLIPFRIGAHHEAIMGPFFESHRPPPTDRTGDSQGDEQ